jgi:serine/threonine-protein kinase RsbW
LDDCEDWLTVVNASGEVALAVAWVERFAARAGLPCEIESRLEIALDETLSNVFIHALAGAAEGSRQVSLCLRRLAERVELEVTDDGPEFDPTQVLTANAAVRITDRRVGGVGLLFVRTLTNDITYTRQNGHNRLTVSVQLGRTEEDTP